MSLPLLLALLLRGCCAVVRGCAGAALRGMTRRLLCTCCAEGL